MNAETMTDKPAPVEVTRQLDRAIDRIMGIEIEAMGGDNLAVVLCSHFDRDDNSEPDDNGWSQSAMDAYDEIKQEIAGLFVPVREALTAWNARTVQAELVEALRPAFVTSVTEGNLNAENVQYKLVFKFRSLAELDAAHTAWVEQGGKKCAG